MEIFKYFVEKYKNFNFNSNTERRLNKVLNQSLDWKARLGLLCTSLLFWILSINDSKNPIYYTSRLVSVCSFCNYIFYNDETRGMIGQIDAIVVRFAGAHFVCFLSVDLWNDIKYFKNNLFIKNEKVEPYLQTEKYCNIEAIRIYYKFLNILISLSVGPIYFYRKHPTLQLFVHLSALVSLIMYSFRNSFLGF